MMVPLRDTPLPVSADGERKTKFDNTKRLPPRRRVSEICTTSRSRKHRLYRAACSLISDVRLYEAVRRASSVYAQSRRENAPAIATDRPICNAGSWHEEEDGPVCDPCGLPYASRIHRESGARKREVDIEREMDRYPFPCEIFAGCGIDRV